MTNIYLKEQIDHLYLNNKCKPSLEELANMKYILAKDEPLYTLLHIDENSYIEEFKRAEGIINYFKTMISNPDNRSSIIDTIYAMFNNGPLEAGSLPSKSARDILIKDGFVVMVVVNGEDGYYALNGNGFYLHKLLKYKEENSLS